MPDGNIEIFDRFNLLENTSTKKKTLWIWEIAIPRLDHANGKVLDKQKYCYEMAFFALHFLLQSVQTTLTFTKVRWCVLEIVVLLRKIEEWTKTFQLDTVIQFIWAYSECCLQNVNSFNATVTCLDVRLPSTLHMTSAIFNAHLSLSLSLYLSRNNITFIRIFLVYLQTAIKNHAIVWWQCHRFHQNVQHFYDDFNFCRFHVFHSAATRWECLVHDAPTIGYEAEK